MQTLKCVISYTNADLTVLLAAINKHWGSVRWQESSVPPQLELLKHPNLPGLRRIKIVCFNKNTTSASTTAKLVSLFESRLAANTAYCLPIKKNTAATLFV